MKNLYKIALLLFAVNILAQDLQNANWALADFGGINFTPPTRTTFNSSLPPNRFGSASVSDQQGNLLFYTNGLSVWDGNNNLMPGGTGLLGIGGNFTQNIVIIPNPIDIDRYYIITISLNEVPGQQYGLRCSEVNVATGIVFNVNTVLNDNLGIPIGSTYPQNYGKITTARHANGLDYWLIAQVGDNIYSYLVDDTGIHNPAAPLPSPLPTNFVIEIQGSGHSNSSNGPIKISPEDDRILIGYSAASDGTNNTTNSIGRIYEGFFNNTTGEITGMTLLPNPFGAAEIFMTGAEFGPNNVVHRFYEALSISSTIDSPDGVTWLPQQNVEINPIPFARNLQRAVDGLIYFENSDITHINPNFMGVIASPGVISYDIQPNVIGCGTSTSIVYKNIPPWVQWQPCRRFLTTANAISTALNEERAIWIHATNKINNTAANRVIYHAGNHLELNPGFETQDNSKFVAYIEGCTQNYVYKNGSGNVIQTNEVSESLIKSFIVSPNPSEHSIDLTIKNDTFNKIIIAGIDGKVILDKTIESTSSYNLDISRYASGVYIVNVVSQTGKQYSQKLIKN